MRRALISLSFVAAAGCATAPEVASLRPTPARWSVESAASDAAPDDAWWRGFHDAALDAIIARIDDGDDVAAANARVASAIAGLGDARAALFPDMRAQGTAGVQKNGDEAPRARFASGGLAASWSPDLFGQSRLRAAAARERVRASEADLAAARLDARSIAARLYFAIRNAQGQARAAEARVASLRETLALVRSRARAGLAPDFDAAQAEAALASAEAGPPSLRQAETASRLSLEALIGAAPGELVGLLGPDGAVPQPPDADPGLAPAAVLARRPDLVAAERRLSAAGVDASAARRDFWPRVSLSALIGAQSVSPENFVSGSGLLYNAASQAAAPVLSFGRLEAARDAADARRVEAAIAYRQRATRALAEVERALHARKDAAARVTSSMRAVAAARDQASLARERYVAGLSPLLEVLVAERANFDADASLTIARSDAANAYADVSAAMGLGGALTEPQTLAAK